MRMGNGIGHVTEHVRLPSPGGECSWCEHCLSFRGLSRESFVFDTRKKMKLIYPQRRRITLVPFNELII